VLLPRSAAANWANAATCNLCYELLRQVRTHQVWLQTNPTQWTTTLIPIRTLIEQNTYVFILKIVCFLIFCDILYNSVCSWWKKYVTSNTM
jgi:hypothetical protein